MFSIGDAVTIWSAKLNRKGKRRRFADGVVEKTIPDSNSSFYMVLVRYEIYNLNGKKTTVGWFKSSDLTEKKT
jgi:hypothetical protein